MNYHDAIIDLIHYVLSQGKEYYRLVDSGNAFDKVVRNYHQFNFKAEKVYRSITRGPLYYRYSEETMREKTKKKELYYEHLKPVKLINGYFGDTMPLISVILCHLFRSPLCHVMGVRSSDFVGSFVS